jgi:pyruvate dehydrogenase E1 component alpha subunit
VGVASAIKRDGKNTHVWTFLGDGATDEGAFYEAHRYAVGHDLPITFIIEDNNRSVETPDSVRWGASTAEKGFKDCNVAEDKILYYSYKPTRPHVGTGTYVHF